MTYVIITSCVISNVRRQGDHHSLAAPNVQIFINSIASQAIRTAVKSDLEAAWENRRCQGKIYRPVKEIWCILLLV